MKINSNILDNKTRLLHIEDNDSNSVSIMVLVNAGSRHEKNSTSGLAHFVEHNFFKGSKKYPSSKIIGMAIENLGGSSNAFTSYEYTGYYIKVPKEKFEEAIDIMADMLIHSVFPSVEVEKERGVIIEEIRMYEDIPMRKVSQSHMTNLFSPGHPLGWDIAGTIDTVSSFGRDNIIDYTDEFYNGSNIIVSIAGGTSKEKTFSVFEKYFSQLKSGNRSKFQKFTKKEIASPINIQKKELEQTHIVLGGYGIKRSDEDRYAVRVGQTILGRGFGSILFQTIREKLSLAYYIHADHSSFQEIGAWDISMGVDNKRVVEAVEAVVGELDSFVKGTFDSGDLDRAKNFMIGNLVTDLETSDDLAQWYGIQELLLDKVYTIEEVKKKIRNITKEDVIESWSKIYTKNNLVLTAISPNDSTSELSDLISGK